MKDNYMKPIKLFYIMAAILLTAFISAACQPAGNQAAPARPRESATEKTAEGSPAPEETIQKNDVPARYQGSFTAYDDKLKVVIDADVEFPADRQLPLYEFAYKQFTQEEVDYFIKLLIGDADLYLPDALEPGVKTKISSQTYSEGNSIDLQAQAEGKGDVRFAVIPGMNGSGDLIFDVTPPYEQYKNYEAGDLGLDISKDEAVALAVQTAKALGAEYMEPVAVLSAERAENGDFSNQDQIERAYAVMFTRKQDGLQTLYTGLDQGLGSDFFKDDIRDRTSYEVLKIFVSGGGFVGIRWYASGSMGNQISDDADLLPFDQVMQRFEDQIVYQNSRTEFNAEYVIAIEHIKLGYLIVPGQDDGQLVWSPVWSFYDPWYRDESEKTYRPYLILNAVDGSDIVC